MAKVRVLLATSAVFVLLALLVAVPTVSARDKDCSDFSTWKQAQRFFKHHDPRADPDDLDGIACEDLPGAPS